MFTQFLALSTIVINNAIRPATTTTTTQRAHHEPAEPTQIAGYTEYTLTWPIVTSTCWKICVVQVTLTAQAWGALGVRTRMGYEKKRY